MSEKLVEVRRCGIGGICRGEARPNCGCERSPHRAHVGQPPNFGLRWISGREHACRLRRRQRGRTSRKQRAASALDVGVHHRIRKGHRQWTNRLKQRGDVGLSSDGIEVERDAAERLDIAE